MKPNEIKGARARLGLTQKDMAVKLGISAQSYAKKESGDTKFTDPEKLIVCEALGLSLVQFNDIFYDGKLPIGTQEQL